MLVMLLLCGRNELVWIGDDFDGSAVTHNTTHDAAGNLTFDGEYLYQYDAWNRLVQVNRAHWDSGANPPGPALDELVRTYSYDGLGRLIRSTAPFPDPDLSEGELRTERFYYDGIRRIQEVVTTPLLDLQGAMMILEDEPAAEALEAEVEPGSLTAGGEESQLSGGSGEVEWRPGPRRLPHGCVAQDAAAPDMRHPMPDGDRSRQPDVDNWSPPRPFTSPRAGDRYLVPHVRAQSGCEPG